MPNLNSAFEHDVVELQLIWLAKVLLGGRSLSA